MIGFQKGIDFSTGAPQHPLVFEPGTSLEHLWPALPDTLLLYLGKKLHVRLDSESRIALRLLQANINDIFVLLHHLLVLYSPMRTTGTLTSQLSTQPFSLLSTQLLCTKVVLIPTLHHLITYRAINENYFNSTMSARYHQLQTDSKSSRSSSHSSSHRPHLHAPSNYSSRNSTSSDSSSSSSASSSYTSDSYARSSMDSRSYAPRVETIRCSRCAKCVETVISSSSNGRVSTEDAQASGMVQFGHNLYYCERCARMVGYA